ncbi:MAG: RecX family transcriptional regulator [Flavobacteriaceae bacterium]|nr:RecX family transcriptional regulator [Flavobacteriaceae bacterium]
MDYSKSLHTSVDEAKRKLERYCAYQERCHLDVSKKLQELGMIPIAIDTIIAHLIEHNFLNEERFAKGFARGKFRIKHWGKNRIVRELKFRDISEFNIKSALKEISEEEYLNTFDELAEKKNNSLKEMNKFKRRKKLADYLLYRGWESQMVYDKTKELIP